MEAMIAQQLAIKVTAMNAPNEMKREMVFEIARALDLLYQGWQPYIVVGDCKVPVTYTDAVTPLRRDSAELSEELETYLREKAEKKQAAQK
jgi:hypothetical protein